MSYFSLPGGIKLLLGKADIKVLECGLLLHQVEVMGGLVLRYLDQGRRVVVVAEDVRSKQLAQQYLKHKMNLEAVVCMTPIEQKEGVFFDLLLRFATQGWQSADLMALLQSGYCFFGLSQADFEECVHYLKRVILQSRAPAHSITILADWMHKYAIDPPSVFAVFCTNLCKCLVHLEKLGSAKSLSLKDFWSEHMACACFMNGRDLWYSNSRIFVDFVACCNVQFNLELEVSFADYSFLIVEALRSSSMCSFYSHADSSNRDVVICSLAEACCLGSEVVIVMDFTQGNFHNKECQAVLLNRDAREFLNLCAHYDCRALENFLSLFYCSCFVYLLCPDVQQAASWSEDIVGHETLNNEREFIVASTYTRPCPCPPVEMRPKVLSVTQLQAFLDNPYGFYVEVILGLKKSDNLDCSPSKSDIGTILHRLLAEIVERRQELRTDEEIDFFVQRAIEYRFGHNPNAAEEHVFLLPKIRKMVCNFIEQNNSRSQNCDRIFTEIAGQMHCVIGEHTVVLTTRCDRIEFCAEERTISIIDYKTGILPTKSRFVAGLELQLAVAALIALEGGFAELGMVQRIDKLAYWDLNNNTLKVMMDGHDGNFLLKIRNQITFLLSQYLDAASGFQVVPRLQRPYVVPVHDHLARIEEENLT